MSNIVAYTQEQINLIKRTIAPDSTSDELALFINQCQRTGLDPMTKQIYFIKDKSGKVTICASIDGLRLIAERSGTYQGQTKPEWCGEDGVWKDVWVGTSELPVAARIGVWKKSFREPTYGIALFDEYAGRKADGKLTFMWQKMPSLMIAKVAEALALRKAFPNDLSAIYSKEEGDIIENTKEAKDEPNQQAKIQGSTGSAKEAPVDGTRHQANVQPSPVAPIQSRPLQDKVPNFAPASPEQLKDLLAASAEVMGYDEPTVREKVRVKYGRALEGISVAQWSDLMDIISQVNKENEGALK